jgi:glutamine synthetase
VDDLARLGAALDIRVVSLVHVGGDGWVKCLDFAPRDERHLRRILQSCERADGSSLFAGIPAEQSDIVLQPHPETAFLDPFARLPTLAVRCGHRRPDGTALPASPDTIVRAAADHLATTTGVRLTAHGEVEFFLGKRADDTDVYGADERGYHAGAPFVFGQELRREALVLLNAMGIPVKYGHSEVGYVGATEPGDLIWEQHEIELDLLPLPDAADAIVLAQWVLRNLAHEHGLQCNTDPIAARRHAGNGLHVHFAVDGAEGESAERAPAARALIGGLVELGGALMAFGNRSADSFVRLRQGRETPTSMRWGRCDRAALVRLPVVPASVDGEPAGPATIEFRLPDGSAHPHLLLAGAAQAARHGSTLDDLDDLLGRTSSRDGGADAPSLPRSFAEVANALESARPALEAGGVFPASVLDAVLEGLRGA